MLFQCPIELKGGDFVHLIIHFLGCDCHDCIQGGLCPGGLHRCGGGEDYMSGGEGGGIMSMVNNHR